MLLLQTVWAQNRCYFCNSQNAVRSVRYGKDSHYVCGECRAKAQVCDLCARPGEVELLNDGRRACSTCRKTRVLDQAQLESVYSRVKAFLGTQKLLLPNLPPVKLANKDEIQTKFSESGRAMDVAGFYSPYNPEQIYVLSGQTVDECAATLTHEYVHAWQSRNCPSQDRALTEGFASWVEYKFLMAEGRRAQAERLLRRNDPDYGASLKSLLEMEGKVGAEGVIKFAKTATKLP